MESDFQTGFGKKQEAGRVINFRNSRKIGFMCVLPLILFVLVYMVYPVFYNVRISFYDWNGIDPDMTFIGAANFINIFKDKVFRIVLRNFLLFALFTVTVQAVLGVSAGGYVPEEICGQGCVESDPFYAGNPFFYNNRAGLLQAFGSEYRVFEGDSFFFRGECSAFESETCHMGDYYS